MSKLNETVKKAFDRTYWVGSSGDFKGKSDYPQEFEQKFGNISVNSIIFDEYKINIKRVSELHEFLEKWGFDSTQQYRINEYNSGYYYNTNLMILVKCMFGSPDDEVEKDDDDDEPYIEESQYQISIYFCPLIKNRVEIIGFVSDFVEYGLMFSPIATKSFFMIAQNAHGLYKQRTSFRNIEIKNNRYDLYYGEKFPHEKIMEFFNDDSNNLMIFYGPPGCGKTNYIKDLIMNYDEDVIYVPPSMINIIADPSFVSFMLKNQGSTLVVEDAEQILCSDRTSATTNLLNLTDGFLKDALKIKILATMNADIKNIDDALLRKGRLHLSHHFDNLSVEDANRLAEHCGINHIFKESVALCDIFNVEEFNSPLKNQERAIGFGAF